MLRLRGNLPFAEAVIFLLGAVAKGMTETTYARRLPDFEAWCIKWINNSNSNSTKASPLWACLEGKDRVKKSYALFGTLPLSPYR